MFISGRGTEIWLWVYPNAISSDVTGLADGVWRIKIAAPPVEGKANRALIAFLARELGVGKGSLTIIKGHTSRNKVIAVDGLTQEEITERLLPT